ncbi:MAG: hypothetical protein NPINA01_11430 [Nitrospinaceae bacterium]|nr:MAG: hypothetical protein NPINA01_11430 [Nitrospinaceae bacterium]
MIIKGLANQKNSDTTKNPLKKAIYIACPALGFKAFPQTYQEAKTQRLDICRTFRLKINKWAFSGNSADCN